MIQIYLWEKKKFAFGVTLNKRDAAKFLNQFEGEKEFFLGKEEHPFSFDIAKCTFPKNWSLSSLEYNDTKGTAYERAMDLMEGALDSHNKEIQCRLCRLWWDNVKIRKIKGRRGNNRLLCDLCYKDELERIAEEF